MKAFQPEFGRRIFDDQEETSAYAGSLEEENARLKKPVADQPLDIQMLKETTKGN